MKKNNQLKLGAILSYVSLITGNIISILYTPLMLRLLGQGEYGLYTLSNSIIGYLGVLDFGLGNAVIRYATKYKALGDRDSEASLYGMCIVVYSILSLLAFGAGGVLVKNVDLFFSSSLTQREVIRIQFMMLLMIFNLAVSFPFGIFSAIITAHEKFVFPKIVGIVRQVLNPFVMIPLLMFGYKSLGMTVASTIINLFFIWINVYYCFKFLKIKIKINKIDFLLLKEIIGYSFFIFLNMIVDKLYWSTDQFILGSVRGAVAVAIYSVASNLNQYYMNLSTAISGVFLPKVTKMVIENNSSSELSDLFIRIGRIQFIVLSFILGGFILVGKDFIEIWAGEGYEQSYFIAIFIMIPLTVPLIQTLGITILQAKNMHKFRSIVYLIIAIINIILSIPLAKNYGGIGCSLATGISIIIGHIIIMNIYYYKYVHIDIPKFWSEILKMMFPLLLSIGTTSIISSQIKLTNILEILITGVLYSVLFFLLMWSIGMNQSEKSLLMNPIMKAKQKIKVNFTKLYK